MEINLDILKEINNHPIDIVQLRQELSDELPNINDIFPIDLDKAEACTSNKTLLRDLRRYINSRFLLKGDKKVSIISDLEKGLKKASYVIADTYVHNKNIRKKAWPISVITIVGAAVIIKTIFFSDIRDELKNHIHEVDNMKYSLLETTLLKNMFTTSNYYSMSNSINRKKFPLDFPYFGMNFLAYTNLFPGSSGYKFEPYVINIDKNIPKSKNKYITDKKLFEQKEQNTEKGIPIIIRF